MRKLSSSQRSAVQDHLKYAFTEDFTALFFRWLRSTGKPDYLNDKNDGVWKRNWWLANGLVRARYDGRYVREPRESQDGQTATPTNFRPSPVELIIEEQNKAKFSTSAQLARDGHAVYQITANGVHVGRFIDNKLELYVLEVIK